MRRILFLFLSFVSVICSAQQSKIDNQKLDSLISIGNEAYLLGQTTLINNVNAQLKEYLYSNNSFSKEFNEYLSSIYKLQSNYNYLKGCETGDDDYFDIAEHFLLNAQNLNAQRFTTGALINQELAQLYYKTNKFELALKNLNQALEYYDETGIYEPGDSEWNSLLMQKAITLARLEEFDEAVEMANESKKLFKNKKSLDYARALRMRAKILGLSSKDKKDIVKSYKEAFELQKGFAMENFESMNSKQREEYWMMLRPFITDAYAIEGADPQFLYDLTLFAKGLLLQLNTGNPDEKGFRRNLKSLNYTWKDIKGKLKKGEAAIEFITYIPFGETEPQLGALVLTYTKKPIWIGLPSSKVLENRYGSKIDDGQRYSKDEVYLDSVLPQLIWTKDLLDELNGVTTVYFSPDGPYHNIAIEYIVPDEVFEARRLSSTRRLMERGATNAKFSSSNPMLLMGDIDYYANNAAENSVDNDAVAYQTFKYYDFPLLGSETDETRKIHSLRKNKDDARVRGHFATERTFRNLAPRFKSILLSTHGIALSTKKHQSFESDLKPAISDHTLSSSVLSLSSVNTFTTDQEFNASKSYDGLISAREISNLNLEGCQLFTMSACQTGLGEVTADGVYGLQRGLKNAGVGAMLLSLWSVHSDATARLMTSFYNHLNNGESLHEAFRNARKDLKKNEIIPEQEGLVTTYNNYIFNPSVLAGQTIFSTSAPIYDSPQYTDAFILIDAID